MSKQNRDREQRRENLRASLQKDRQGGFTTHAAEMMAKPLGGIPIDCTLVGSCRTFVFEFPQSEVVAEEPVQYNVILGQAGMKAAIVCNLPAYFEEDPAESLHFDISVSFRSGIRSTYENSRRNRDGTAEKLFLVIEEHTEFAPITMSGGQCFSIDEVRDGEAMIVGGRQGEKALIAFPALGCPWPDAVPDMHGVNVVLAAVKAVQNVTGHITQLAEYSCFVSNKREAVYTLNSTMSVSAVSVSRLTAAELKERTARITSMVDNMMSESAPVLAELFDSVILDKSTDDGYLRLAYLRLWQAIEDARRQLAKPGLLNEINAIAGNRAPTELKGYRNAIAHWHTGTIDHSYLNDLQYTILELLRRKYEDRPQRNR